MDEDEQLAAVFERLMGIREPADLEWIVRGLTNPQQRRLMRYWTGWAHEGQRPEGEDWRIWLMLAGRGFGKTLAGAEWVTELARADGSLRIALVGATLDEVADVMVRGSSGLMAVARTGEDVIWRPTSGVLTFSSGAQAFAFSGANPDALRGPEHHFAWCDELAKWRYPEETWDNLMLGLRLGERPRALVTTTPRPIGLVRQLRDDPAAGKSQGSTAENPHLPEAFLRDVSQRYAGTRLGRQELDGEILEDVEGALWTRELVERCRSSLGSPPALAGGAGGGSSLWQPDQAPPPAPPRSRGGESYVRIVIGVDPPVSAGGDACGIVAVGLGGDGIGYVLADHSVAGLSPEGWARAVAAAAEAHGADRVVAEANQGGAMVESVLKAADCALPVRLVHARRGKSARAEPVAALFESGRAKFAGTFPELEDQLCGMCVGGGYEGPGRSPDRADAMVWALTELMLGKRQGRPAVRGL
jgi:phage terminase large subunit-like protein